MDGALRPIRVEVSVADGYPAIVKNRLPSISVKTRFTPTPITRRSLQALATAILLTTPLHAANISWSGGEGDFNDTTKWTGGVLPGVGDTATVANGGKVNVTDARTVGGLDLPDGSLGITPGQMFMNTGVTTIGQLAGKFGELELDNGQFFPNGSFTVGTAGGSGSFSFYNGFMMTQVGGGSVMVGEGNGSEGDFVQLSGFLNCMTPLLIGSGAGATGLFDFSGSAAANANDWFVVGADGASGTFKISGNGSFNKLPAMPGTHVAIGRGNGSSGVVEQTSGLFTNVSTDTYLGESGNATASWSISGSTTIAVFSTLIMGYADQASATLEHHAGTISAHRIMKGDSTGNTSISFNGGKVTPRSDNPSFLSGIDSVTINAGGLIVDTTPDQNSGVTERHIGFEVDLLDGGGGLTKRGPGSLTLDGICSYVGATVVEGGGLFIDAELSESEVTVNESGTIGGDGTIGGAVTAYGTIAPGHGVGTLTVEGNVSVTGTLAIELTPTSNDVLAVEGELNVEDSTLRIELPDGQPLTEPYVIATYGTRTGNGFAAIEGGVGYTIDYAYQGNKIAVTPAEDPYASWASNYEWVNEGDELAEADPDGDGFANALEFFLGGDPLVGGAPSGKPVGAVSGDRFLFTFGRSAAAALIVPVVEYGTELDFPSVAVNGEDGVIITSAGSPGDELWTVSFPLAPGGKFFARLKVEF